MDLTAKLHFDDADKALQLVAELARSETARSRLVKLAFDNNFNAVLFKIDSIDFFKEWQTSKQDFCKAYGCYADFIVFNNDTLVEERQIVSPAGEVLLEEANELKYSDDGRGLIGMNPEFGKTQIQDFLPLPPLPF